MPVRAPSNGRPCQVAVEDDRLPLVMNHEAGDDFRYSVRSRNYRAMAAANDGAPERHLTDLTQDQILHNVLNRYRHYSSRKTAR